VSTKAITQNRLFSGDNLYIQREHIPDESVNLIYTGWLLLDWWFVTFSQAKFGEWSANGNC
jgi:hypothetical protein